MNRNQRVASVLLAGSTVALLSLRDSDGPASVGAGPRVVTLGRAAAKAATRGASEPNGAGGPLPLEPRRRAKLISLILDSAQRALIERRLEALAMVRTILAERASERLLGAHDQRALDLGIACLRGEESAGAQARAFLRGNQTALEAGLESACQGR